MCSLHYCRNLKLKFVSHLFKVSTLNWLPKKTLIPIENRCSILNFLLTSEKSQKKVDIYFSSCFISNFNNFLANFKISTELKKRANLVNSSKTNSCGMDPLKDIQGPPGVCRPQFKSYSFNKM